MITTFDESQARQHQSLDYEIVGLLDRICRNLEITEAMSRLAEERYISIAHYLEEKDSSLAVHRPVIYPQGSAKIETTVKPIGENEFDVDVICQLLLSERTSQTDFLNLLYDRLAARKCYTLKRMNRCVRVQYANEFHIDITPGIADRNQGPENIFVTDKELGRWKESNPKDYAKWFHAIAQIQPTLLYEDRLFMRKFAAAEPLPARRFSKPTVNRIVQLLKRHRDLMFQGDKKAPISAIITTLTANSYAYHVRNGQFPNQIEFLRTVVSDLPRFIVKIAGEEYVPNPRNPLEDYADKWKSAPERREAFYAWHDKAILHLEGILQSLDKGKESLFEKLALAYGTDAVKKATIEEAEFRKFLTEKQQLGVSRKTGITAPIAAVAAIGASVLPVKTHTFHGS
jgi:Second Messenger Oligonucleotide or Dinucleotide Synthetase domain